MLRSALARLTIRKVVVRMKEESEAGAVQSEPRFEWKSAGVPPTQKLFSQEFTIMIQLRWRQKAFRRAYEPA